MPLTSFGTRKHLRRGQHPGDAPYREPERLAGAAGTLFYITVTDTLRISHCTVGNRGNPAQEEWKSRRRLLLALCPLLFREALPGAALNKSPLQAHRGGGAAAQANRSIRPHDIVLTGGEVWLAMVAVEVRNLEPANPGFREQGCSGHHPNTTRSENLVAHRSAAAGSE